MKINRFYSVFPKLLHAIFENLQIIHEMGQTMQINWLYKHADEDMEEAGRDFEHIFKIPFNFIEFE